ncbi:hypothetical protein AGABI2DRAFT_193361 [Agaricus bisporus var. bisporus H97]|uniref:hypothetical protein n=1 Tax=Agaricus bisporus var. bisporus (strain H97 / ATCC MYA-4626 / FGSC 10389) TaxID=936046 RepID=UPI00029F6B45|nr:hypothetical protein AGABI2DRAFT_193361 [Agaricus bisporus var. bisporus H97]EKV46731.1 hypothetical protein AGABI2DRAFT_193361 [Agaricus bisporus var. bisporus H97]
MNSWRQTMIRSSSSIFGFRGPALCRPFILLKCPTASISRPFYPISSYQNAAPDCLIMVNLSYRHHLIVLHYYRGWKLPRRAGFFPPIR